MKFTTLLKEKSEDAVETFRGKDMEVAYNEVNELRNMLIWQNEACGNIHVAFINAGIPFELKDLGCIEKTLGLLTKIQVRLAQLRDYYEDEVEFEKLQSPNWEVSMSSKFFGFGRTITSLQLPVWKI